MSESPTNPPNPFADAPRSSRCVPVGWRRAVRWPIRQPIRPIDPGDRRIIVFGDVHLTSLRPGTWTVFVDLLRRLDARTTAAVICLGDLFEFYIGASQLAGDEGRILAELGALRARGVPVTIIPGNRDFLIGQEFRRVGVQVIFDWLRLRLPTPGGNRETWITHGDALMVHDSAYLAFRAVMHLPFVRTGSRFVPPFLNRLMALALRANSARLYRRRQHNQLESPHQRPNVRRVSPHLTRLMMSDPHAPHTLILGHFHLPFTERGHPNGGEVITVGDWHDDGGEIAVFTQRTGWQLIHSATL